MPPIYRELGRPPRAFRAVLAHGSVPGIPGEKTLAQLYQEQVDLGRFPATGINGAGGLLPSTIENGITHHQNWPYTLWFAAICEYAKNQAMWNCAYDLIQYTPGTPWEYPVR